jgi:oligopeptide transport system substrate-binding protein
MLAEAGYPNGADLPTITFIATANDANRLVGQFLEDQLKRNIGVETTTEYLDSRTRNSRFIANQYQILVQSWSADWPYPDNWLPDLFGSKSPNNHLNFANTRFDELIEKAAAETDDKKRLSLYGDAHKLLLEQAAIVPLYHRQSYILVKPKVKDLVFTPLDGGIKGDYHFHRTYIAAN